MASTLRTVARRLSGVRRVPTYFLPWVTRPGLECVLLVNNISARLKVGYTQGPFPVAVSQFDADGRLVRRYETVLADSVDTAEITLTPTPAGCGFVTVEGERLHSGLYVALSDGDAYTATHGRGEFVEHYPAWTRAAAAALGGLLALFGRTLPAFRRGQYVYAGADSRSHLLLVNLSNVTNRIRVSTDGNGTGRRSRLLRLPPRGARLLPPGRSTSADTQVRPVRLEGNAWFNLYVVGAGTRDLAGPLSLMHVK
jgi:hypothetical protein